MSVYRRLVVAWCSLWLLASGVTDGADKKPGEKWAVLIGVDDYLNAADLKYCGVDQARGPATLSQRLSKFLGPAAPGLKQAGTPGE